MKVTVQFFSYFKDLAGMQETVVEVGEGTRIGGLLEELYREFPKLEPMRKSMLVAVGLEYQDKNYVLQEGDVVSLFPPVQGG